MSEADKTYLTTGELAELLRIKERKVYDLAAAGEVPCVRVVGKLLFPRAEVERWIARHHSGPREESEPHRPPVVLGSHDPLLDWALKESGCGLASLCDGSFDGLERFASGEGQASGLHIYDAGPGAADARRWNVTAVEDRFSAAPVALVEWARRQRGLIVREDDGAKITDIGALKGKRIAARQSGAGSQALLETMLERAGLTNKVTLTAPARTESDAALLVAEGKADAALGLLAPARQFGLKFQPITEERFDLVVCRRAWFEPGLQVLAGFCRSPAFAQKAGELGGYDVSGFGTVHFNGG